jgi:hypothetical protein
MGVCGSCRTETFLHLIGKVLFAADNHCERAEQRFTGHVSAARPLSATQTGGRYAGLDHTDHTSPQGLAESISHNVDLVHWYFLMQTTIEFSETGFQAGKQTTLTQSYRVEVYSRDTIPLGASQISVREQTVFNHYRGLRLLTHNNGKYYLFREVDEATCRPKQVFVIPDTEDIYVIVKNITPVRTPCTPAIGDQ